MNINIGDNISIEYDFVFTDDVITSMAELGNEVDRFVDAKFPYIIRTNHSSVIKEDNTYHVKIDGISARNVTDGYLEEMVDRTGIRHAGVLTVLSKKIHRYT